MNVSGDRDSQERRFKRDAEREGAANRQVREKRRVEGPQYPQPRLAVGLARRCACPQVSCLTVPLRFAPLQHREAGRSLGVVMGGGEGGVTHGFAGRGLGRPRGAVRVRAVCCCRDEVAQERKAALCRGLSGTRSALPAGHLASPDPAAAAEVEFGSAPLLSRSENGVGGSWRWVLVTPVRLNKTASDPALTA